MTTFHGFIKENCVGRKIKWSKIHSYFGDVIDEKIGVVEEADEDYLGMRLEDGSILYGLMKDLEMADATIEWLS